MAREVKPIRIPQFDGGLNLHDKTIIEDNQLSEAVNVCYGNDGLPHKRYGFKKFGAQIGTKPVMSLFFYEETDGERRLLANSGTTLYKYVEGTTYDNGTWIPIKTGLKNGKRFGFYVYKDISYMGNGTDSSMRWNGSGSASYNTGSNAVKWNYGMVANDVGYVSGVPTAPSATYYTSATPATMQGFSHSVLVDEDNGQINTGLQTLGPYIINGKERSIHRIDIATPAVEEVDYGGGVNAHRTMVKAENNIYFVSDEGTYTLAQRQGVAGSFRAKTRSANIHERLSGLDKKEQRAGVYFPKTKRLYYSVNIAGDNNNRLLVYDIRLSGITGKDVWTEYTGLNANDFTVYREADGTEHLLFADSYDGQIYEMEISDLFTDDGSAYEGVIGTKNFDYNYPDMYKESRFAVVEGYISEPAQLIVEAFGDDDDLVEISNTILGSSFVDEGDSYVFNEALGIIPFDGESEVSGTVVYKFKARLNLGIVSSSIRLRFKEGVAGGFFRIINASLAPDPQPTDYFPVENIY